MSKQAKYLIEVAMPVKEVSAESIRDKSIRHGHISTLHLWWARRPLPVSRAVVFASLVPDPLDEHCPQAFRDAVQHLLGPGNDGDPYKPYKDIPFTAALDPMEDNLRNRLLMFIGRYSAKFESNEKKGLKTQPKEQLAEGSLIKWESRHNKQVLNTARKLIWVAHDPENNTPQEFDRHFKAIEAAEQQLTAIQDRHHDSPDVQKAQKAYEQAVQDFQNRMPKVFDPFAGGGAIPLEAARLGCRAYGNDLNPVAYIIQKAGLEFPQKYGKPIRYSKTEFIRQYGEAAYEQLNSDYKETSNGERVHVHLPNRLAYDVEYYAHRLLERTEAQIGHYYPANDKGKKPIAYYWARTATCSNPSCGAEVPLLRDFYLVKKPKKKIYLEPVINGKFISFQIRNGQHDLEGWQKRGNLKCPVCGNITPSSTIKQQSINNQIKEKLLAVIEDSNPGKTYRLPTLKEIEVVDHLPDDIENYRPTEKMQRNSAGGDTFGWGITQLGQMFSNRQLLAMQTLVDELQGLKEELQAMEREYGQAVITYLAVLIDRITPIATTFGRWDVTRENIQSPFSRQAIPMIFDYPEGNVLGDTTGSIKNQLKWIVHYIKEESNNYFSVNCRNAASGERHQFQPKELDSVVTDPPYYDAIAYADLSDFFYIWLKKTVGDLYPMNFAFPQTPKSEEATALKHHHNNSYEEAKAHFENKLQGIFSNIEEQTQGIVSVMFAHQSTEAWGTLINSILGSNMNISSSWSLNTELANRMVSLGHAALASSITVSCKPIQKSGFGDYKEIKNAIHGLISREVEKLYAYYGFRGADLLTACFGKAVSVFGGYEHVEKADGTPVSAQNLLEMARDAAFHALVKGMESDALTSFYMSWLQLYGFSETNHDDVRRITQVGLNIDVNELLNRQLLVRSNNHESLATMEQRTGANSKLGYSENSLAIDRVHRAMEVFQRGNRPEIINYLAATAPDGNEDFWRVLNAIAELVPDSMKDGKLARELHTNKDSFLREARQYTSRQGEQTDLGL